MDFDNLVNCLLANVSELQKAYKEEMEWLQEELQHVIFGQVLNPHLIKLLNSEQKLNEEQLIRIFNFLEEMANSNDVKVKEVLLATVLESIVMEREIINKAKSYMGENTLRYCEQLEKSFGWV